MPWNRIGKVFGPEDGAEWIPQQIGGAHVKNGVNNCTQVPTVLILADQYRIYFSSRALNGQSYPLFIDVDKDNPTNVLYAHKESILGKGNPGCFDEDGIMPGFALHHEGKVLMYYSGWNAKISTPYHNATGLAQSTDGGINFTRVYEGPVMDRIPTEPQLAVTPTIMIDDGLWKAWYISGIKWILHNDYYEPVYGIKYATSTDGVYWERFPELCIPQAHDTEAFSHPTVLKNTDGYEMWYCFRDSRNYRANGPGAYRIGYAYSTDGKNWTRADEQKGFSVSNKPWENEMVCYPFVIEDNGRRLMFYNGNGFGRGGIGVAEWVD